MPKSHQIFSFIYPLSQKRVRDLKIVTDHIGDLLVEGTGYYDPSFSSLDIYDRYDVDIDAVKWNGTNILPVLEVAGFMEEITEAAIRQFASAHDTSWRRAA